MTTSEQALLIDELLPHWHFRERHQLTTDAAPANLLIAVDHVTWADVPVMRSLMRIRSAGRMQLDSSRPISQAMAPIGFAELARDGDEVVFGAIGRPWTPAGGRPPAWGDHDDPARRFADFTTAGWAKMAFNFRVSGGELSTETRVLLTDDRSRRAFRRYWFVIRPFSGLIRRRWLVAIARRATSLT